MATAEIMLATTTILQRFELVRAEHGPIAAEFSTTLRPHGGLRVTLRERATHGDSARAS